MSAYGSGTGPESLDEPDRDEGDPLRPYTVTTAQGMMSFARYKEASRLADDFVARGVAVAITVGGETLWSLEPGRAGGEQ